MDGTASRSRGPTIPHSGNAAGVLYLDAEAGWGGSSRSLFYLIDSLDRRAWRPIPVLRRNGPIVERYAVLGLRPTVVPQLPSFRPSERKNLVSYGLFRWDLRHFGAVCRVLEPLVRDRQVALVHVNHENLALVGDRLARRCRLPWVCHVRTQLIPGVFARRVYRLINSRAAAMFFIADPVRDHFARLVGPGFDARKSHIVHNIMPLIAEDVPPLPAFAEPADAFRVLSLSNFSPNRGVDRIVDVALELTRAGRDDFIFYLCGRPANTRFLSRRPTPYFEKLRATVRALGLDPGVRFPGHLVEPERALVSCHTLIKLSRQANPWGRDIMEALAAGLPVVTLGTYQGFVEHRVNGFIEPDFDAARIARHLIELRDRPELRAAMARSNRDQAARLFNGPDRAREVGAIYESVLSGST